MKLAIVLAALVLAVTGCGGGSAPPLSGSGTQRGQSALEDAYRTYVEAFFGGDGATAYALLSDRCQKATSLSEFAAASESAADIYGQVDYTIDTVTVDGNSGSVDSTFAADALNSDGGSAWIYEDKGWRSDKCD